jgi:CRP-like cAMP-binding protein
LKAVDIESIPLFAGLCSEDRSRIAAVSRALHLDPGQVAVQEGEFAFNFYAIKTGTGLREAVLASAAARGPAEAS